MEMSSSTARELPNSTAPAHVITGSVESFDATRIHYDFYDASSRSLVVVVPGFWRFRRHPSMSSLATLLNERGYRVAVVDVRGHGDSEGTYGFNLHEHFDVYAVTRHLLDKLQAVESVTFVALSYGAAIAISAAARHPDLPVASLLLISPVADFSMIVPRINPFTIHRHIAWGQALRRPRFDWHLMRSAKLRAVDDVREVHAPICFIHVKNDWLIGHTHSEALYAAAHEPKELHVIDMPGNYHADRLFIVAKEEIEPMMFAFLDRHA
jgi:pimeloyl-ACP methyl ester carboxylesterase